MKRVLKILGLPSVDIVGVGIILSIIFMISARTDILEITLRLIPIIAFLIYLLPGGFVLSKIEDKKSKRTSITISALLFIIIGIIMAVLSYGNDTGVWASIIILPISIFISSSLFGYLSLVSQLFLVIAAPLPIIISAIGELIFNKFKRKQY